ncbi:MAG: 1-acyl-sn-glycerol-3-phosphate acyltransferase [Oscillospiraceae bacterium]|jgi:1-acyl-sn-glycerol-3-phosphate acyltransferase|nr:1-acyl-sn-glycerol-3-phosphate acyltransferase [Oscillospiraceae bacterium]
MPQKKRKKADHTSFWYYGAGQLICSVITRSHDIHIDNAETKDLQPPFIALGNHQGQWDWAYAAKALLPHKLRIMLTRYQLFRPVAGWLMLKTGAIPKSQFAADAAAVREVLRTIKRGGAVFMYPSGRISLFGEDAKPFRGTYELLCHLKVPVVMVRLDGSYRTGPRYNPEIKKSGRVDVKTSVLFTPEELQTLPEEEARARLDAAFSHDDFASPNQGPYKSKNLIAGLEDLLYLCPRCKSDFTMKTEGTGVIQCENCGFSATMDDHFRLTGDEECPATISAWGRFIRAEERRRADANPDYSLQSEMQLCEHVKWNEMLSPVGTVLATYDAQGFHLKGDRHGEPFERFYSCAEYPAIHFLDKIYIIVPDNEDVICAMPPTAAQVSKFAVVSEVFSDRAAETAAEAKTPALAR